MRRYSECKESGDSFGGGIDCQNQDSPDSQWQWIRAVLLILKSSKSKFRQKVVIILEKFK